MIKIKIESSHFFTHAITLRYCTKIVTLVVKKKKLFGQFVQLHENLTIDVHHKEKWENRER
jgi:hypothetical protein